MALGAISPISVPSSNERARNAIGATALGGALGATLHQFGTHTLPLANPRAASIVGMGLVAGAGIAALDPSTQELVDAAPAAAVAGVGGTAASHVMHKHAFHLSGRPLAVSALGVGLMSATAAGLLHVTNTGDGRERNSLLQDAGLATAAFGVPGIWIHGRQNPLAKVAAEVGQLKGVVGVAGIGAAFGIGAHLAMRGHDALT